MSQFTELVDQLTAYASSTDPLYYTMKFVDGLKDDVKSAITIQWPPDLDTACSFALVQEETADASKKKEYWRFDGYNNKQMPKSACPLPIPARWDKSLGGVKPEGKKGEEPTQNSSTDDKLLALRKYRRARGLCERCAERWKHGHKCATTVQLHAMEEI